MIVCSPDGSLSDSKKNAIFGVEIKCKWITFTLHLYTISCHTIMFHRFCVKWSNYFPANKKMQQMCTVQFWIGWIYLWSHEVTNYCHCTVIGNHKWLLGFGSLKANTQGLHGLVYHKDITCGISMLQTIGYNIYTHLSYL